MAACPECGAASREGARYCSACGAALPSRPPGRELRKTVTVVFADVAGWTSLGERHDPERLRRVATRYFDEARAALERHGGTVEKFIGDAVVAVFGTPVVHEDDALRAVRAAVELRTALAALNEELERAFGVRLALRIGVQSGEVIAGDPAGREAFVTGDTVNVAERLESAAGPDEILLGEATYALARDAVRVERVEAIAAKGKSAPIPAYRLLAVREGAPGRARRLDSPLVGRGRELHMLRDAFARALGERSCHLFTVLGAAGVGKSRLVAELEAEVAARATILRGRCLPYGEGVTFAPLIEVVRQATGIAPEEAEAAEAVEARIAAEVGGEAAPLVAERLAELLGLRPPAAPAEETSWAFRKLLEALARRRLVLLVLDDLHWAEPTLLELVEHVADWARDAPILLVCMARPELLDSRPGWGGGKLNATSILLEPLSQPESARLVSNLLGRQAVGADVVARIQAAAEGNPLFVEETVAMLVDDGLLRRRNGGWVVAGGPERLPVPPTIQLLLAARLDRLPEDERHVLGVASVEGKVFHREAVEALVEGELAPRSGACLVALARKELVRAEDAPPGERERYRFRHVLLRDAAYDSLPKDARAELHERYAGWLEGRPGEHDELVGFHLEQAARYRSELGPPGERGEAIAERAGERLASAGRRALERGDTPAAVALLERAAALLPAGPARVELLPELAIALGDVGELARAEAAFGEAIEAARTAGDERLEARTLVERAFLHRYSRPDVSTEELEGTAELAVPVLERLGDDAGLARAWRLVAEARWSRCQIAAMEDALARALPHARRAGERRQVLLALDALGRAAVVGPTPVAEGIRRCEDILAQAGDDPSLEAFTSTTLAYLEAMRGGFERARALAGHARALLEDLGRTVLLAGSQSWVAAGELLAGEPEEAERILREAFRTLEALGEKGNLSTVAATLAEALYAGGKDAEAERLTDVSRQSAAADDVTSQVAWRATRAKLAARRGDGDEAARIAAEAVAIAEETDALNLRAEALVSQAEVELARGAAGGPVLLEEALALFEAKGNTAAAERLRARLADLVVSGPLPGERAP